MLPKVLLLRKMSRYKSSLLNEWMAEDGREGGREEKGWRRKAELK